METLLRACLFLATVNNRMLAKYGAGSDVPTPSAEAREDKVSDLVHGDLVDSGCIVGGRPAGQQPAAAGRSARRRRTRGRRRALAMDVTTLRWRPELESCVDHSKHGSRTSSGPCSTTSGPHSPSHATYPTRKLAICGVLDLARVAVLSGQIQERRDESAMQKPRPPSRAPPAGIISCYWAKGGSCDGPAARTCQDDPPSVVLHNTGSPRGCARDPTPVSSKYSQPVNPTKVTPRTWTSKAEGDGAGSAGTVAVEYALSAARAVRTRSCGLVGGETFPLGSSKITPRSASPAATVARFATGAAPAEAAGHSLAIVDHDEPPSALRATKYGLAAAQAAAQSSWPSQMLVPLHERSLQGPMNCSSPGAGRARSRPTFFRRRGWHRRHLSGRRRNRPEPRQSMQRCLLRQALWSSTTTRRRPFAPGFRSW